VESLEATHVSSTTLPVVVRPAVTASSVTSTSVSFNITNRDDASAFFTWNLRQGTSGGTVVSNGTTSAAAAGATINVSIGSLTASTTYWLTDVVGKSNTKADCPFVPSPVSNTTSAPPAPYFPPSFVPYFPPSFVPYFPPSFVPYFPPAFTPFFPPDFAPFFPPTFGGCLDINTPIYFYNGTVKLLKDIEKGDELIGYYIPGMIYEDELG
jgi:hypothetical protein